MKVISSRKPFALRWHHTFSGFPPRPTNEPLLVYRFWDAERNTERRENGEPRTSNLASVILLALVLPAVFSTYQVLHHSSLVRDPHGQCQGRLRTEMKFVEGVAI